MLGCAKYRYLKTRRWVDCHFVHLEEQFVLVFNNPFSSFAFSFRNVRTLFHFSEWTDTLKYYLIKYKLISKIEVKTLFIFIKQFLKFINCFNNMV